jgi:hypothetical protein
MHWLTFTTNHGNEITVPDLSKLTEEQVEEKLDDLDLAYVLLDSVDYRDDFLNTVWFSKILTRCKSKRRTKVYIKINSSGFSSVKVPDLIEKTYREVPTLKAGLEEGTTYIPIEDMVLRYTKEKRLSSGKKVLKASKIGLEMEKASYEEDIATIAS